MREHARIKDMAAFLFQFSQIERAYAEGTSALREFCWYSTVKFANKLIIDKACFVTLVFTHVQVLQEVVIS